MNIRNQKLLLVTLASLSTMGVAIATHNPSVAASPYFSGQETTSTQNTQKIVVNLFDTAGQQMTWTKDDGANGGSSIEYDQQNGNQQGLVPINLPDGLIAQSAKVDELGTTYRVVDGKLYVDLSTITGGIAHFELNAGRTVVATPDDVVPGDDTASEPVRTETDVVPNEPVVAPVVPHTDDSVSSQAAPETKPATNEPTVVAPDSSAPSSVAPSSSAPQTSPAKPDVSSNAPVAKSDVPTVAAAATSAVPTIAATRNTVAAPASTANQAVATPAEPVILSSAPVAAMATSTPAATVQSVPVPVSPVATQDEVQAVKKPDLISSVADLPKSSIWTDKARTFSAISIGMSAMAVAAQLLMTKLGLIKKLL